MKASIPFVLHGDSEDEEKNGKDQPIEQEFFELAPQWAQIGLIIVSGTQFDHLAFYLATTPAN